MGLKIVSINCNGIKDVVKRSKLVEMLKIKGCDIVFLQETHITEEQEVNDILKLWGGTGVFNFGSHNSRGVAILFYSLLDIEMSNLSKDLDGRVISVDSKLGEYFLCFICVYAPNNERERKVFFNNLDIYMEGNRRIVLGGDFNFVENISLDKLGGNPNLGNVGTTNFKAFKSSFNLKDCFRNKNPYSKEYTWHSTDVHGRLDRFYVDTEMFDWVENVFRSPCVISDHHFVELNFKAIDFNARVYGPGYRKCNVSILKDKELKNELETLWNGKCKQIFPKNEEWWESCKKQFKDVIVSYSRKVSSATKQRRPLYMI